jgi:uncharacterized membrane protein
MAEATIVAGLPIPSTSPVFLAGVGLHVLFGLTAVATGAVAMLSRKGPGRHPRFGGVYYWSLAGLAVSAAALAIVRWREDAGLFALALVAFAAAFVGRRARRRLRRGWPRWHAGGMGGSYIVMLTAFYVDNGANLPGWRLLPHAAYWIAPSLVGLPILLWTLARHPVVRAERRSA